MTDIENDAVIAIVFEFDALFPTYNNDDTIQTDIDLYNRNIRILDRLITSNHKYMDLYLYTTADIIINSTSIFNGNSVRVTKHVKRKIFEVFGYFKNVIKVTDGKCEQYMYTYKKENLTKYNTELKYKVTECNNYLQGLKQKYTKVFYYLKNTSGSGNNPDEELNRFFTSDANNTSKPDSDIRKFINNEVAKIKFKYYLKILQIAQKFKTIYPEQITAFLKSIENTNETNYNKKTYKHTYNVLKFIYSILKNHSDILKSIPEDFKSNAGLKLELKLPKQIISDNDNDNNLYNDNVSVLLAFLITNSSILVKSYYPDNAINYPIATIIPTLKIIKDIKDINITTLDNINQIIHYILNFYNYELPGINPEYIYGYDSQKCSAHIKHCRDLYDTLLDGQKQESNQLYYAFVDYVTKGKDLAYYTNLVASAPNGILESIYKKQQDDIRHSIKTILQNYITEEKAKAYSDYYATNDENYLLSLVVDTSGKDALANLNFSELYTLYNYVRRCDFLKYLSDHKRTYSGLYDFALSIPHETPNPAYEKLELWVKPFNNIFRVHRNKLFRFVEPYEKMGLLDDLDANKEIVKMSSGSGAFRVKYTGNSSDDKLSTLFIKGYEHSGLFDPTNIYKRFAVSVLNDGKNNQLCISNTRIFNEIIMNYLIKKITETDTKLTEDDKNNIHTYDFIYTPNDDTVYIAQPAIGLNASIADGEIITTLKDLLAAYYEKLKSTLNAEKQTGKRNIELGLVNMDYDFRQIISNALCMVLRPYLDTLQKLSKTYEFVHTDLHFGNIFIKSSAQHTVCTGLQAQCNATASTPNSRPPGVGLEFSVGGTNISNAPMHSIHEKLINDLQNTVLLIADYDLARLTIDIANFKDPHIKQIGLMRPDITHVDFKSIFIEDKALEDKAKDINIVPKEKKRLQKKETVIRTRCAYAEYALYYKDINDDDYTTYADMLIYSNWDILSIFINVIAFLKKCEYKIYGQASGIDGDFDNIYKPIIDLFQPYVLSPHRIPQKHMKVCNRIMHIFYACVCKIYAHKKFKNWVRFLFEGKFSFITRVFEKFKGDYATIFANVDDYTTSCEPIEVVVKSKFEWLTKLFAKTKKGSLLNPEEIDSANATMRSISESLNENPGLLTQFRNMLTAFKTWIKGLRTKKVKYSPLMESSNNTGNIPSESSHREELIGNRNSQSLRTISNPSRNVMMVSAEEEPPHDTLGQLAIITQNTAITDSIKSLDFDAIAKLINLMQNNNNFVMNSFIETALKEAKLFKVETTPSGQTQLSRKTNTLTAEKLMQLQFANIICFLYTTMAFVNQVDLLINTRRLPKKSTVTIENITNGNGNKPPNLQPISHAQSHTINIHRGSFGQIRRSSTQNLGRNTQTLAVISKNNINKYRELSTDISKILTDLLKTYGIPTADNSITYLNLEYNPSITTNPVTGRNIQLTRRATTNMSGITPYSELLTIPTKTKTTKLTLFYFNDELFKTIWILALILHFFKLTVLPTQLQKAINRAPNNFSSGKKDSGILALPPITSVYLVDTDKFRDAVYNFSKLYNSLREVPNADKTLNTLCEYHCNNKTLSVSVIDNISVIGDTNPAIQAFINILTGLGDKNILSCKSRGVFSNRPISGSLPITSRRQPSLASVSSRRQSLSSVSTPASASASPLASVSSRRRSLSSVSTPASASASPLASVSSRRQSSSSASKSSTASAPASTSVRQAPSSASALINTAKSLKQTKTVNPIRKESNSIYTIKKQILDNVFNKIKPIPYSQNRNEHAKIESLKETLASKTSNKINNAELKNQRRKLKGRELIALRKAIEDHSVIKGENNIKYKIAKLGLLDALSKF